MNIHKADRIALGIFSGLFLGGGVILRGLGYGFYWMALIIGLIMGAIVLVASFFD